MGNVCGAHPPRRDVQFGLARLLEYVTVCAILSAFSTALGYAATIFLMLMALALWARQGFMALAMLMAASLATNGSRDAIDDQSALPRQLFVILTAIALCGWYRLRRHYVDILPPAQEMARSAIRRSKTGRNGNLLRRPPRPPRMGSPS